MYMQSHTRQSFQYLMIKKNVFFWLAVAVLLPLSEFLFTNIKLASLQVGKRKLEHMKYHVRTKRV